MPITLIIKLKQMHPKIWISKFWPWVNKLECGREWYFLKACSSTISSSLQLFECSREHNMSHMKRGPWLWIPCLQAKFYKGPLLALWLLKNPFSLSRDLLYFRRTPKTTEIPNTFQRKENHLNGLDLSDS